MGRLVEALGDRHFRTIVGYEDRQSPSTVGPGGSRGHYRHLQRVGQTLRKRQEGLPELVKRISWQAQVRLNHKYRRLMGRGKAKNKAVVALARELLGFIWAMAWEIQGRQAIKEAA